jgi:hypothetical protein
MEPTGEMKARRTDSTWKAGSRDSTQQERNLGDEEYFDQELRREKNHVFGLRKGMYLQK